MIKLTELGYFYLHQIFQFSDFQCVYIYNKTRKRLNFIKSDFHNMESFDHREVFFLISILLLGALIKNSQI